MFAGFSTGTRSSVSIGCMATSSPPDRFMSRWWLQGFAQRGMQRSCLGAASQGARKASASGLPENAGSHSPAFAGHGSGPLRAARNRAASLGSPSSTRQRDVHRESLKCGPFRCNPTVFLIITRLWNLPQSLFPFSWSTTRPPSASWCRRSSRRKAMWCTPPATVWRLSMSCRGCRCTRPSSICACHRWTAWSCCAKSASDTRTCW